LLWPRLIHLYMRTISRTQGGNDGEERGRYCGGLEKSTSKSVPKSPNNVTSNFFNTVHLLPKDLSFEHGGAKLASCPGRHLISLRLWLYEAHPNGSQFLAVC